jgi:hypothetical protein
MKILKKFGFKKFTKKNKLKKKQKRIKQWSVRVNKNPIKTRIVRVNLAGIGKGK